MRILVIVGVLLGPVAAQGLQLSTANLNPIPAANALFYYGGPNYLPFGPVTFPTQWSIIFGPSFNLLATGNQRSVDASGTSGASFSTTYSANTDLVTTLVMPSPARIAIQVQTTLSYTQTLTLSVPGFSAGVDLDADGNDEFFNQSLQPTVSATLTTWCDDIGSLVRWHHDLVGPYTGGFLQASSSLTLDFDDPVQEATYGPTCAGKLGCQLGSGTYDRIFVASLPFNTTFAWLMAGTTQQNVLFPGIGCPLLVTPDIIIGVPLFQGPNGRQFVDLPATFPAWPGSTWYAQGVAISGGTFVGTNGVIVQT